MSEEKVLKLAFIGGSLYSAVGATHFSASRMDGKFRLVAGAFSRDAARNKDTAKAWRVDDDRLYADYHELLANEKGKIDAVCLLTPTPDHADQVCEILKAGYRVISEKPLAMDMAEIAKIRSAYDPAKNYLAVTFNYTGYAMFRELGQRCRAGEIGNIHQIMVEMPQESFTRPPDIAGKRMPVQNWRLTDGTIPMISLDLGTHLDSLISYVTGEKASEVMAASQMAAHYPNLVSGVHMWARYGGGVLANFWFTKTAVGHRNGLRIRIYGDKGSAEWYQMEPEILRINWLTGEMVTLDRASENLVARQLRYNRMKPGHPSGYIEAFANYYTDLADDIVGRPLGKPNENVFTLDDAAEGLALFEAAARSVKSGSWEKV